MKLKNNENIMPSSYKKKLKKAHKYKAKEIKSHTKISLERMYLCQETQLKHNEITKTQIKVDGI